MFRRLGRNSSVKNMNSSNHGGYNLPIGIKEKEKKGIYGSNTRETIFQLDFNIPTACDSSYRIDDIGDVENDLKTVIKIEPEEVFDPNAFTKNSQDDFQYNDVSSFQSPSGRYFKYIPVSEKSLESQINEADQANQQLDQEKSQQLPKKKGIKRTLSKFWNGFKPKPGKDKSDVNINPHNEVKMRIETLAKKMSFHVLQPNCDYAFIATEIKDNHLEIKCSRKSCNVRGCRTKDGKYYINQDEQHSHGSDKEFILSKIKEKIDTDIKQREKESKEIYSNFKQQKKVKQSGSIFSCFGKNNKNPSDEGEAYYVQDNLHHTTTQSHQGGSRCFTVQTETDLYSIMEVDPEMLTSGRQQNSEDVNKAINLQCPPDSSKKKKYTKAEEVKIAMEQLKQLEVEERAEKKNVDRKNQLNNDLTRKNGLRYKFGGKIKTFCSKLKNINSQPITAEQEYSMKNVKKRQYKNNTF